MFSVGLGMLTIANRKHSARRYLVPFVPVSPRPIAQFAFSTVPIPACTKYIKMSAMSASFNVFQGTFTFVPEHHIPQVCLTVHAKIA